MFELEIKLKELEIFNAIDFHFANFMVEKSEHGTVELYLATLLCSYYTNNRHTAFDLQAAAGQSLLAVLDATTEKDLTEFDLDLQLPTYDTWTTSLLAEEKLVANSGRFPLIISEGLIYLHRYHSYECEVAKQITARTEPVELELLLLEDEMAKAFPRTSAGTDWQQVATFAALKSRFCVISGGPGTGKTTTVAKVLMMLLTVDPNLKIDIVAPTGKAADRLVSSIKNAKKSLQCSDDIKNLIPEEASTVHRYLGFIPGATKFRFNADNRKNTQLLLVDEASMVSLPMFAKLLSALDSECRVILLGDKDQLSAVEAGNVMGDICDAEHINQFSTQFADEYQQISGSTTALTTIDSTSPLENTVVKLMVSYRFDASSGIGNLSKAVNECDVAQTFQLFANQSEFNDISLSPSPARKKLPEVLKKTVKSGTENVKGYSDYMRAVRKGTPQEMLTAFDQFQILCSTNKGDFGVTNVNELIENALFPTERENYYHGKAIMVTVNDYAHKLFNGDIGVIAKVDGQFHAFFAGENGEPRQFSVAVLPENVPAFAMTIHKSQGSEFNDVLMILPDQPCAILGKEIIYTGITRAKENVAIWSNIDILTGAIEKTTKRISALKSRLQV